MFYNLQLAVTNFTSH